MTDDIVGAFTGAYIGTALWCGVERKDDDPLKDSDRDTSKLEEDFDPADLGALRAGAALWCGQMAPAIREAENTGEVKLPADGSGAFGLAGKDFWLTRNGHGANFKSGDWPEPFATTLYDAAKAAGEIDLFIGEDDKVYRL